MRTRTLTITAAAGTVAVAAALAVGPTGLSFAESTAKAPTEPSVAAQAEGFLGRNPVPTTLVPPAGNVLTSVFKARGVQVYGCTTGTWALIEPAASLTGITLNPARPAAAIHFRGPSWQSDSDGTLVEGMTPVSAPSATPNSIPQLLVTAKLTRGSGVFGGVTFIQRLNTVGGIAPTRACTATDTAAVSYRADYRFFKAA